MAKDLGLSQTAVSRIWRAFGLQPHRQKTFKLSTDPFFVEKVRDVVGLYVNPPARALVLCVDENPKSKPWIARSRCSRCGRARRSGAPRLHSARYDSLSSQPWTLDAEIIGSCHRRHRHQEFLNFLKQIDRVVKDQTPAGTPVHLVMDNLRHS